MSALTSGSATAIENQSITPASPRLSKVDLIAALAKELQRERMKGAGLVNLVEDAEQQLDARHNALLDLEHECEERSRKNEAKISDLRLALQRARASLEAALNCPEGEAQHYLELLEGARSSPTRHRRAAASSGTASAIMSPPPRSPARPRGSPTTSSNALPQASPPSLAAHRTKERLRQLELQLDETLNGPAGSAVQSGVSAAALSHNAQGRPGQARRTMSEQVTVSKSFNVLDAQAKSGSSGESGLQRSGSRWNRLMRGKGR